MILTDTHTHLYLPEFDEDRAAVVQRAKEQGIQKCILPNIDSDSIPQMKKMFEEFPDFCFRAMGLHPTSVKENFEEELVIAYQELQTGKYIAVGEMGIDLYWDKTFYEQQKQAFRTQAKWATDFNLPLIIHSRDSFEEIFELMDDLWTPELKGVFHCFTGTQQQANKIVNNYGFKLGLGGVLTFKNSTLREEIKEIDTKHFILETDAPFLAPAPKRGKRNESAYITLVAQKLAEVKNCSVEEIAEMTTQNAMDLFNFTAK
jgi:TatD DNase family protein